MIATSLGIRVLLLVPVVWLAMVVYAGLKETDAAGTIRSANHKTIKTLAWLVGIAVAMFAIEWVFID
jgi:formate-dependent nitrite reductase membrane component NrfD